MSARDQILSRIRSAVAGAPTVEIPREYRMSGPESGRVELFAERVRDYRAIVHLVPEEEVAVVVARALSARGARRVVLPEGLSEAWLSAVPDLEPLRDDPHLGAAGIP